MSVLSGLLGAGTLAASAYLPYEKSEGTIDFLKTQGPTYGTKAAEVGSQAAQAAQFQPFAVTTGTGSTTIGEGGNITQQLAAQPASIQQQLLSQTGQTAGALGAAPQGYGQLQSQALQQAQGLLGQATPTAQDLFQQMQATTAAEQERQRLALENRLAAQGRLGTQTAAFGGTPEQLALEKAIQEQTAQNYMSAQQMAPQLAQQQIANATGLFGLGSQAGMSPLQQQQAQLQNVTSGLGAAFLPEQQQLAAMQNAAQLAQIAQTGRLGASEALYRGGIAGLETEAATDASVAALESARVNALANALSGMFQASAGASSPFEQIVSLLGSGGN